MSNTQTAALLADEYTTKRDQLLMKWADVKLALETAKLSEIELRKELVAHCFDSEQKTGTQTIELGNGYKLKSVKKLNYNLDQTKVNEALDQIELVGGEVGKHIASKLVKWKADLSLTEYKDVDEKYKKIIDTVLTTSEGSPTLELVEPKDKKKL